jgi:hypothetical protein
MTQQKKVHRVMKQMLPNFNNCLIPEGYMSIYYTLKFFFIGLRFLKLKSWEIIIISNEKDIQWVS